MNRKTSLKYWEKARYDGLSLREARVLLKQGADPNFQDKNGRTPLMYASAFGNAHLVSLFLKHGANPFLLDNQGKTAHDLVRQFAPEYIRLYDGARDAYGDKKISDYRQSDELLTRAENLSAHGKHLLMIARNLMELKKAEDLVKQELATAQETVKKDSLLLSAIRIQKRKMLLDSSAQKRCLSDRQKES